MAELPPPHPAAHPGVPAPQKTRTPRRRQRHGKRAPHLTAHPLARHRLKGRTAGAAAITDSEKA